MILRAFFKKFSCKQLPAALYLCLAAGLLLSACSSPAPSVANPPANFPNTLLPTDPQVPGVYHVVQTGETLWRIAKHYGRHLPDLLKFNPHLDITDVSVGTKIFVPHATQRNLIHAHSATKEWKNVPSTALAPQKLPPEDGHFHWPVKGRLDQRFGEWKNGVRTKGVLIAVGHQTSVTAPKSGTVLLVADHFAGLGRCVLVNHGGLWSMHGHLDQVAVKKGARIRQGQIIGTASKNKHLYLEVRRNGRSVDPMNFLP